MKKSFYLQSLLVFCFILVSATVRASVPVITAGPINTAVCQGDTAKFTVAANDTPGVLAITYSWLVSTDGGTTWSLVKDTLSYSGSSTDTLVVSADSSINSTLYKAIATNSDGADTSASAILTVRQLPVVGAITGASIVCKSSSVTLSDTTAGGAWSQVNGKASITGGGIVTGVSQGYDSIKYAVTNTCGTTTVNTIIRVDTMVVALPITGPTTTCKDHFINLMNLNVLGTWTWSASNANATVSSSGVVTGASHGTDVITYLFTNACNSVSSSVTITVDTLLYAGVISGASNVCEGSWIHLSETVGGGAWFSDNSSIAVVDAFGNVTGVSQGTDIISYYFSNGCGASIATDTIMVDRPASVITGGDSVGIGATLALSDSAVGGSWATSDTLIATIDPVTGVATGTGAGVATISYTVTNICGTSTALLTLYVGGPPSPGKIYGGAGYDSSVCVGATMALFDTASGGVGSWSLVNDTTATIDATGLVTGVKSGLDTVIYTFTNAFGTSRDSMPIVVNTPAVVSVIGPAIVSMGGNYFFSGYPAYTWNPPNAPEYGVWTASNSRMGIIVSVSDSSGLAMIASFVVTGTGTDTLTYKIHNQCGYSTQYFVIDLPGASGVNPVISQGSALNIYPNPTDGAFTINLSSNVTEQAVVTITNVVGQKVNEINVTTNKAYNIKLDQPAGMYFLSATTSTGKYDAKVTVTK